MFRISDKGSFKSALSYSTTLNQMQPKCTLNFLCVMYRLVGGPIKTYFHMELWLG